MMENLTRQSAEDKPLPPVPRRSRFLEGTFTNRSIKKPPSMFIRHMRPESRNDLPQFNGLMEDYINDRSSPRTSTESAILREISREKASIPQRVADINAEAEATKKENGAGIFGFGRQLAATFRPVAFWNKLWAENKHELTQENIAKAEEDRKAKVNAEMEAKYRNKADFEAQYAEMMRNGGFNFTKVGPLANGVASEALPPSQASHTPRDSGIDIDDLETPVEDTQIDPFGSQQQSDEHKRSQFFGSQLALPVDETTSRSGSEVPDTTSKPHKGVKSRLQHFKNASLTNIKVDLKRVKSDFNLAHTRDSSSSVSPIKTNGSTLTKSISKSDLRKQHKLSKRVSDLEAKLEQARRELGDAIGEASPMPKLSCKYESFTPVGSITINKRPKFTPGNLPSLPSERLLMAEQMGFEPFSEATAEAGAEAREPYNQACEQDNSHEQHLPHQTSLLHEPYHPQRGSSLFKLENGNIENLDSSAITVVHDTNIKGEAPESIKFPSEPLEMEPDSLVSDIVPEPFDPVEYADLDAKLQALEKNMKKARQQSKSKKRKSGAADEEKAFKPGEDSDDDAEWDQATPRKKRKAALGKRKTTPMGGMAAPVKQHIKGGSEESIMEEESEEIERSEVTEPSTEMGAMEQVGHVLEPVYEEDSEMIAAANGSFTSFSGKDTTEEDSEMIGAANGSFTSVSGKDTTEEDSEMIAAANGSFTSFSGKDITEVADDSTTLGTMQSECTELKMPEVMQEDHQHYGNGDSFEWPDDVF